MKNGLKRFYRIYNRKPGPSHYVFDRKTGEKIHEGYDETAAIKLVNLKNEEDAKERGIEFEEAIDTPFSYYGSRSGIAREIAPMVRHGSKSSTVVEPQASPEATAD